MSNTAAQILGTGTFVPLLAEEFQTNPSHFTTEGNNISLFDETGPAPAGQPYKNRAFSIQTYPERATTYIRDLKHHDIYGPQTESTRSGHKILRGITNVFDNMGHDIYVGEDIAYKELPRQEPGSSPLMVNYGKLSTLTHGQSFYNRAGFYGRDHVQHAERNQKVLSMPISKYIRKPMERAQLMQDLGLENDPNMTVREVGAHVKMLTKRALTEDEASAIPDLLDRLPLENSRYELKYKGY